jgi:hypothetical protein
MPKRYHKTMKGGFWNSLWNSTKKATTDAYNSVTGTKTYTPTTTTSTPVPTTSTQSPVPTTSTQSPVPTTTTSTIPISSETVPKVTVGGRKKRSSKRGGFTARTPTTGLAFHAAPVSNIKNAQPHNWVGGRTKRQRKHKHSKSCKHRKH